MFTICYGYCVLNFEWLCCMFAVLGVINPCLVTTDIRCRLFAIALAWISPFILLGISYPFPYTLCCIFKVLFVTAGQTLLIRLGKSIQLF